MFKTLALWLNAFTEATIGRFFRKAFVAPETTADGYPVISIVIKDWNGVGKTSLDITSFIMFSKLYLTATVKERKLSKYVLPAEQLLAAVHKDLPSVPKVERGDSNTDTIVIPAWAHKQLISRVADAAEACVHYTMLRMLRQKLEGKETPPPTVH